MPFPVRSLLIASILAATASSTVRADDAAPVMVSLATPVLLPSWDRDVSGFRLSLLYGDCCDFAGFDIGVVSRSSGSFDGLGIGGVNIVNGRFCGLQVGLFNWSGWPYSDHDRRSMGVQYGGINFADSLMGLQSGYINMSTGLLSGVQYAYVNCANDVSGVQCGGLIVLGVNVAYGTMEGCQIGIVNYAQEMACGAQIGILNIIARNGVFPVLPVVNCGF